MKPKDVLGLFMLECNTTITFSAMSVSCGLYSRVSMSLTSVHPADQWMVLFSSLTLG